MTIAKVDYCKLTVLWGPKLARGTSFGCQSRGTSFGGGPIFSLQTLYRAGHLSLVVLVPEPRVTSILATANA